MESLTCVELVGDFVYNSIADIYIRTIAYIISSIAYRICVRHDQLTILEAPTFENVAILVAFWSVPPGCSQQSSCSDGT